MWPEQSQSKCGQPCSTPYERIDSTSTATIALNVENNMHISNAHKAAKLHCLHLERQPRIRRINNKLHTKNPQRRILWIGMLKHSGFVFALLIRI